MTSLTVLGRGATAGAGVVLAAVIRGLAAVRPAAHPLHPKGRLRHGQLVRHGARPPTGVAFLDETATEDVLVRESRAVGLPKSLPDIHGLALRVPNPDGTRGDLLFATTGFGRVSRFVLTWSRTTYGRPMTTLLPYDTAAGPVILGARAARDESRVELSFAVRGGEWHSFGELRLSERESDEEITFDPVLNTPPGLGQYAAVRTLREPSYRQARDSRR